MILRGILRLYGVAASHRIRTHRELLDLVDKRLEEGLSSLEQEEEAIAGQLDIEEQLEYEAYLAERYQERQELKSIFFSSLFAGSFALFEHELVRICERAKRESGNPISVKDFGGRDYLENTKRYLRKLGMTLPVGSPEWQQAVRCRTIRNKIMHDGGIIGENDDILGYAEDKEILVTEKLGEGLEQHELRLTREFCEEALTTFDRVLHLSNLEYGTWHQQMQIDAL